MTAIRRATPEDIATIAAIEAACFDAPWSAATFLDELVRPVARLWVAEADARIVGYVSAWIVADEAHLHRLGVTADARGSGIGMDLVEIVLAEARAHGCAHVDLEVARGNAGARRLYARAGFVELAVRMGYYRNPVDDALVLRRSLRDPVGDVR